MTVGGWMTVGQVSLYTILLRVIAGRRPFSMGEKLRNFLVVKTILKGIFSKRL